MYRITVEWHENGRPCLRTISSEDKTKEKDKIVIGRDENECDIIFKNENTISRKHMLIYYDDKQKNLLLKNLTSDKSTPNPIIVDGKIIILQVVPLNLGNVIRLGKITMQVTDIALPEAEAEQIYGIKCINGHLLAYDYIGDFCPHCGISLQTSETAIMPRPEK